MSQFKIGDVVKVKDWGKRYSTYYNFFADNDVYYDDLDISYIARYEMGIGNVKKDAKYKIVYIGKHYTCGNLIALIEEDNDYECKPTYLIGIDGLDFNKKKMTLSDIENALGYKIELIKD